MDEEFIVSAFEEFRRVFEVYICTRIPRITSHKTTGSVLASQRVSSID